MSESTPCNIEDVTSAFVESRPYIYQQIENKMRTAKSLWRDLISREAYEYGHGYIQYTETFHGGLNIQDSAASWKVMAKYRAPGTNGAQDAGYDPCKSQALVINNGTEEKSFTIYQTERRTLDYCLTDMLFFWQLEQQLALIYQALANVTLGEWEQIMSRAYESFCIKAIARQDTTTATGLDTFTLVPDAGAVFGGKIAIPVGGLGTIGRLTTEVLDRVYQYLVRQCADAAIGMNSGSPVFGIASSEETIRELISEDSKEVTALYWAMPEINIEGYGKMRTYKNWAQYNDWNTQRYKVSADGLYLEPVYPYTTTPTTIGDAINVNPDYINAPFEISKVFLKDVFTAQVPPPNPASIGGGFKFDPVNNIGDFEFMNIQERCDNPRREKGFFLARYRMAPKPGLHSTDAIEILHRRCNVMTITECTQCTNDDTTPIITAVVQYDATEVKAATQKWILTLDGCLDCQIGSRVTILCTKAGSSPRYGVIADNWAGTDVVIVLDTASDLDAGITVGTDTITCAGTARQ